MAGDGKLPVEPRAIVKELPERALDRTVQALPSGTNESPGGGFLTYYIASIADTVTQWGRDVVRRDKELRAFWPTESFLAGAIYSLAASHAALNWELSGPPATRKAVEKMLHEADLGAGWETFVTKLTIEMLTQDNGAFIETIRAEDSPDSPVVGLAILDSGMCTRTGNPEMPVVYMDRGGKFHALKWYQVIALSEMPSPQATMFGVQYCGVTRVLRFAQILRDTMIYKGEKISGRFERAIHIVGGPSKSQIDDVMARGQERADNQGLARFSMPLILASLDPERPVSHVELPLASLPDGFNFDEELRWYIAGLALGFGRDYQDFAPLPGGNLGTSQQSEILHLKSRGKGPALFMRLLQHKFNFAGVLPKTVTFTYAEQDLAAEGDKAKMARLRAETRKTQIESGEITAEVARQMAVDVGDLDPKYLTMMSEDDITPVGPRVGPKPVGDQQDDEQQGGREQNDQQGPVADRKRLWSLGKPKSDREALIEANRAVEKAAEALEDQRLDPLEKSMRSLSAGMVALGKAMERAAGRPV